MELPLGLPYSLRCLWILNMPKLNQGLADLCFPSRGIPAPRPSACPPCCLQAACRPGRGCVSFSCRSSLSPYWRESSRRHDHHGASSWTWIICGPFPSAHPWTVPPTHTSRPETLQGHSLERSEAGLRTSGWCMWLNPGRLLYKPRRFCWAGGDPLPSRLPITSPRSSSLFIKAKSSSLKCLPLSLVLPARPLQEPVCEPASLPGLLCPQTFTSQVTLSAWSVSPSGSPIIFGFPFKHISQPISVSFLLMDLLSLTPPWCQCQRTTPPQDSSPRPLCLQPSLTRDRRDTRFHKPMWSLNPSPHVAKSCAHGVQTHTTTITSHLFFVSFGTLTFLVRSLAKHKWKITQDDTTHKNDCFLNTSKELNALQCFRLFTFRGRLLRRKKNKTFVLQLCHHELEFVGKSIFFSFCLLQQSLKNCWFLILSNLRSFVSIGIYKHFKAGWNLLSHSRLPKDTESHLTCQNWFKSNK